MTKNNNPLLYLFGKTWHYSRSNRSSIVLFWSLFLLAELVDSILLPLVWAKMMNVIQESGIQRIVLGKLLSLLLLSLVGTVLFWSLHGPARVLECLNAFLARTNYRRFLLKGVMTMPLEWHTDHHSGDTIDKIEKGTGALFSFSEASFEIIYSFASLCITCAMLVYISGYASIAMVLPMVLSIWITMRFDKVLIGQYQELNRSENNISESVFDTIGNITTVIILRVERLVFNAIMTKVEKPYDLYKRNCVLNEFKWFLTNLCSKMVTVSVFGIYLWQHVDSKEAVLIGDIYLLIRYLQNVGELFFRFTGLYGDIVKRKARVMNSEELTAEFKEESFANHVLPEGWRTLTIRDLNFSYGGDTTDLHLDDISLAIQKGEKIAFVGETGSGKTTLLKVIRDLYHPKSLSLWVDGVLIQHGFEGISRAISLVPQNPEIFSTTIRENITLGAEYDEDFLKHFTDMACFTEVLEKLPKNWESSIKEKGVNLSGGQQQRLALSRGLLACHDKDVILLDEPTSSLDLLTEMRVYQNIFQGFSGKTIISSIHRLHLLPLFDRIVMFDKGQIIGSGTLAELLSGCPEFAELWRKLSEVTS